MHSQGSTGRFLAPSKLRRPVLARSAQGEACALHTLDLRGNRLAQLPELAVLAGCPHLRHLALTGAGRAPAREDPGCSSPNLGFSVPENPVCGLPCLRGALAAALPQLGALDGTALAPERRALPSLAEPAASAQARHKHRSDHRLCAASILRGNALCLRSWSRCFLTEGANTQRTI